MLRRAITVTASIVISAIIAISTFLAVPALANTANGASFVIGQKSYRVNGETRQMDVAPFVENNRTYVPVRFLGYSLGMSDNDIGWDGQSRTVTLVMSGITIKLVIGGRTLLVNGRASEMDVVPLLRNNRTFLPARWVSEAFGYKVDWINTSQTVLIEQVRTVKPNVAYKTYGLNFSPYMDGQDPNLGVQVIEDQLRSRMEIVAPYTQWIRTFGCTHGLEKAGSMAHALNLRAAVGAWLSSDTSANESEISNLINAAKAGQVDLAIVGSEVLLRNELTEAQLIAYINRVKQAVPEIQVTTADVYGELLAHPNVIAACDVVFPNYYPYWQGVKIDKAVASIHKWHQQIIQAAKGKPVIVSEAGWPSDGDQIGEAMPSSQNAALFFLNFASWARANNVAYFYFESFDESFKASYEGPQGAHWGVWNKGGTLKLGMQDTFDGKTVPDNWSDKSVTRIVAASKPSVVIGGTSQSAGDILLTEDLNNLAGWGAPDCIFTLTLPSGVTFSAKPTVKLNGSVIPSTSLSSAGNSLTIIVNGRTSAMDEIVVSNIKYDIASNISAGDILVSPASSGLTFSPATVANASAQLISTNTPPATPTGLSAIATDRQAALSWDPNTEADLAGYNLYRNGGKITTSLITTTSNTDSGLVNDTTYSYQVTAVDTAGLESQKSELIKATPTSIPGGPGTPSIEFTYLPAYGSFDDLRGQVWHVKPADYKVAVYIYVSGWWTKPYWNSPLTAIQTDGSWRCDITTGGIDQNATKIAAFLVPDGYSPPSASGASTLPAELDNNAIAKVEATRLP